MCSEVLFVHVDIVSDYEALEEHVQADGQRFLTDISRVITRAGPVRSVEDTVAPVQVMLQFFSFLPYQ
jgi:hypothetical protein